MLSCRCEDGRAQRDRLQVIASAYCRFATLFQSAQEFGHCAGEGIGKPNLGPTRLEPIAWLAARRKIERAGGSGRIAWPANGAAGQSLRPLHAPANCHIARTAFVGGPGPDIIPAAGPAA